MGYAEVIYETGASSIVNFDDLDELKAALANQHNRAMNGEPGSAQDYEHRTDISEELLPAFSREAEREVTRPAERVKRVFLYKEHPANLMPVGNEGVMPVPAKVVGDLVSGMTDGDGNINMHQLTAALRDEASPVYTTTPGKFESHYKMEPAQELTDLSFLSGSSAGSN